MDALFLELILSIFITAIMYVAIPLFHMLVNGGRFDEERAKKLALWNSIILGAFFCITTSIVSDTTWNATLAFLYYWINRALLTKKNQQPNTDTNEDRPVVNSTSQSGNNNTSNRSSRFLRTLVTIIAVIVMLAITIYGMMAFSLNSKYMELKQEMRSVGSRNFESIGGLLNEFPHEYRDISMIKSEYNLIKKNVAIIEAMPSNRLFITSEQSNSLRTAYAKLVQLNKESNNWGLDQYIDTVHDSYFWCFVFGKEWANAEFEFYWCEDRNNPTVQHLYTNLPNQKEIGKVYCFYGIPSLYPEKFGFQNTSNSNDRFLAFRIVDVLYENSKWSLKIYCYANARTYILR